MPLTNDLTQLANSANVLVNSISINTTAITSITVGGQVVNTTGIMLTGGLKANGSFGTANQVLTSNGTASYWANASGGATVSVSDSAPGSPQANSLWWKSDEGRLYIYYNDGNSSQWVSASPDGSGQYLPLTGGTITGNLAVSTSITINNASVATTGKAIAMAIVFGG